MPFALRLRRRNSSFSVLALALCLFAGLLGAGGCEPPRDWCSGIVVRPDQRFIDPENCVPQWTDREIAQVGEVVMIGDFMDVTQPVIPQPGRSCNPSPGHPANASYAAKLRKARADVAGPPLHIVHEGRFDLVPTTFAAKPGFSADFLLRTTTPWSSVTGFFTEDTSAACVPGGCRLSDSYGAKEDDVGRRLRDFIDASAGSGRYKSTVYYLARPTGTDVYWPSAAMANLASAPYRAWRVAEAKRALTAGTYDSIQLDHKLHQYYGGAQHWLDSGWLVSVQVLEFLSDTFWTARPVVYGYSQYVSGWYALSQELVQAGVPYAVTLPHQVWSSDKYDDLSTSSVNEATMLRDAGERAKVLMIDAPISMTATTWQGIVAAAGKRGAKIVRFDQACPLAGE